MNTIRQVVAGEGRYGPMIQALRTAAPPGWESRNTFQSILTALHNSGPFMDVGSGVFRQTFAYRGINDVVVKVARKHKGLGMNRDDWRLGIDRSIRGAFTRAFARDPSNLWVILERVRPFPYDEGLIFERFPAILEFRDAMVLDNISPMTVFRGVMYAAIGDVRRAMLEVGAHPGHDAALEEGLRLTANTCMRLPAFAILVKAVQKHSIGVFELNQNNMGVARDGRLVILDSSLTSSMDGDQS